MTKRTLPNRSTRGQLPPHLRQQSSPPKITKCHPEDQNEVQRKETVSRLKINQLLNLKKYPFGRAVHYFFDLDQFPRASSTISYAVNEYNIFKDTYSKDCQFIKGTKIGDLMNRKLLGLPINLTGEMPSRKQNKCKNVCYAYLFQIQDKKHNNDRLIYTIKSILKRLPKINIKQLERYDFIKKDSSIQEILSESMGLIERKEILSAKLQILQLRKQTNRVNWQFEDKVLFYHALNQRLHNSVIELKNKLTEEYFYRLFFEKQRLQYESHLKGINLEQSLPQMTHYYYKNLPTLSLAAIKNIIEKQRTTLVTKNLNNKFTIQYPIAILDFGRDQSLLSFTEFLIARRTFSMGEVHFYEAKTMIKKLFRRDLKLKSEKITSYDQYYKHFKRKYEEICRFNKIKSHVESQEYNTDPLLDKFINESPGKVGNFNLFNISQRIDITKKQFIFSMIYFWLCQCMASILPYLTQFQDLLEMIGSDFYPKVCNPLVEAIGTPLAGFIFYIFESLTDLMSKNDPLVNVGTRLLLEYNHDINVCMIWRGQTIENKSGQFLEERNETNFPNKKIKRK